ncbi:hypothetical protein F2P81_020264 [Scophthalmus maximus]|uniref:Uncharacterized protein n=1 Tax=Scophthalmus maximus TaxID=52904 RepID=A0A6A4RZK6_SCOMX|nr:hypothetical protein F2P81_020264 [Scophthalmus maximus]
MLPSPRSCGRWIGAPSPTSSPVPAQWHNLDLGAESHVVGLVGLNEGGCEREDGGSCVSVIHVESRSSAPQETKLDLLFVFRRTE